MSETRLKGEADWRKSYSVVSVALVIYGFKIMKLFNCLKTCCLLSILLIAKTAFFTILCVTLLAGKQV